MLFIRNLRQDKILIISGLCTICQKLNCRSRIDELLEELGLTKVANKEVSTFSGGMKRRVNLAIGLIHQPAILFLDEPTVGVDVQSKNAIIKYLEEINQAGTTIVYTSHHMSEAEEFCNRIALIDHGKVVAEGGIERFISRK